MVAGDFNLILDAQDKNNANIKKRNMGRFRCFMIEMELKDVILHGRRFTWSNNRQCPTLEKLDRILVSVDWEEQFPDCFLQALSTDILDHYPLLLATNAALHAKPRFHFEKYWLKLPAYQQAIEKGWTSSTPPSDPYRRLDSLLRNLACELQSWGMKRTGHIKL